MIFCLVLSLWLTNLKFVLYFSVYFVTVLGFTPSATTTTTIVWRSTRGRQWGIVQYADSLVHEWLSHRLLPGTQTCQERPHYHKSHLHWVTTNTRHICRQIMQPQPIYIYRTLKLINLYIRIVYVGGGGGGHWTLTTEVVVMLGISSMIQVLISIHSDAS